MSPRYSIIRADIIDYRFWLVFDADGGMRFSRGEPACGRGERAMSCTAVLPRSLFRTPELKASIGVAQPAVHTFEIDVQAATEALRQVVGCDVEIRIERPDEHDH